MRRVLRLVFFAVMAIFGGVITLASGYDLVSRLAHAATAGPPSPPVVQALHGFDPNLAVNTWSEVAVWGGHCRYDALYDSGDYENHRHYVFYQINAGLGSHPVIVFSLNVSDYGEFREKYANCSADQIVQGVLVTNGREARLRRLYREQTGRALIGEIYIMEPILTTPQALRRFKWVQGWVVLLFSSGIACLFGWLFFDTLRNGAARGSRS